MLRAWFVLFLAFSSVVFLKPAVAQTTKVDAGNIFHNIDAQRKCPVACRGAGGTWDGNWRTEFGRGTSTCDCKGVRGGSQDFRGRSSHETTYIEVPTSRSHWEPKMACFHTCPGTGGWTGDYRPAGNGRPALCGCKRR